MPVQILLLKKVVNPDLCILGWKWATSMYRNLNRVVIFKLFSTFKYRPNPRTEGKWKLKKTNFTYIYTDDKQRKLYYYENQAVTACGSLAARLRGNKERTSGLNEYQSKLNPNIYIRMTSKGQVLKYLQSKKSRSTSGWVSASLSLSPVDAEQLWNIAFSIGISFNQ